MYNLMIGRNDRQGSGSGSWFRFWTTTSIRQTTVAQHSIALLEDCSTTERNYQKLCAFLPSRYCSAVLCCKTRVRILCPFCHVDKLISCLFCSHHPFFVDWSALLCSILYGMCALNHQTYKISWRLKLDTALLSYCINPFLSFGTVPGSSSTRSDISWHSGDDQRPFSGLKALSNQATSSPSILALSRHCESPAGLRD